MDSTIIMPRSGYERHIVQLGRQARWNREDFEPTPYEQGTRRDALWRFGYLQVDRQMTERLCRANAAINEAGRGHGAGEVSAWPA